MQLLAASLPFIVNHCELSALLDEWIKYQCETIDSFHFPEVSTCSRIDHYWRNIFNIRESSGKFKFEILPVFVKSLLSLAHENSDVERGFSDNNRMLENRINLTVYSKIV